MPPRPISRVTLYLPASIDPTGIFDSLGTGRMDATGRLRSVAENRRSRTAFRCYAVEVREELWVLGELAGEAAHELRNALAVIGASATLLRAAEGPQKEAHIAKIERNARLAQGVVDSLM